MPLDHNECDDPTLLRAGARFNDKIPCNCGLSYCNGWAFRRTRSRHLAKVEGLRKDQATGEDSMEDVKLNVPSESDESGVPFEPPEIDSHGNPYEDDKQDEADMEDSETEAENMINKPNPADTWSPIDTPPASRPETPVLIHDEDLLDDGEYDGFVHVDHEDIEIYERWFTEDCEDELRELQREMISDEDLTNIKMMSIRLCGHISRGNYDRIRHAFRKQLQLYTLFTLQKRIAALCGISTVFYDRCRNNCLAFTGGFSNDYRCRSCLKPRYKADGKPAAQYEIIPLNGRLRALFLDRSMAKSMRYRHLYAQHDGLIEDIFDSELYKTLCQQFVTVDGHNTGHRYFEGERDIAFSLLGDGVQLFEQGHVSTNSCWPIVFQNLNLPPSERCKLNNILPLTVIPGPNQPKDFNSFFHPFVEELIELAGSGISAYDEYKKERFTLRGYPLIVCGDMQAIKHFGGMKGPNAKSPCRMCRIVGVYDTIRKTNYIPLVQPFDHQNPPAMLDSYDPHNLPLRTTAGIQQQEAEIKAAPTKTKQNELATHYGLSHPTILDRIPSLSRPDSYPHEFMHLFLLNHGPNLVDLWVGKFKGISGPGSEEYMIPPKVWAEIGQETFVASRTIPSAFTRVLPNIATDRRFYNAESWAFWLQYIGPVVLRGRLLDKYYEHYLELVWIIKALLQLSITTEQLDELEQRTISYVERFEEYYYQYDFERLSVCKLTLHALLHVPSDVRRCGPVWTSWSFLIERYCAVAVEAAGSKVNPYKSIANRVLEMAQLAALALQHKSVKRALRMGIEGTPGDVSSMEHTYEQYPLTILRFPCLREYAPDDSQRRRLAGYFCEQLDAQGTFNEWFSLLPTYCTRYGKVRVRNGGDYIRSAIAGNPLSSLDHRDASFVRYVYWRDKHENYPRRAPEMVKTTEYGRLECILVLKLEPNVTLGIQEEQVRILADITPCVCVGEDATLELVSYRKFQPKRILDIQAVECVVGRIESRGNWYFVDRSTDGARTGFVG